LKQLLVNFLIALSGVGLIYLAATAQARDAFWYRPQTDKEKKIDHFLEQLEQPGI